MICQGKDCKKVMTSTGKTFNLRCHDCQRDYFLDIYHGAPEGSGKRDRIAKLERMLKGDV